MMLTVTVVLAVLSCVHGQSNFATNQLSTSALGERAQRALFSDVEGSFVLPINTDAPAGSQVDNAAAKQLQADKTAFPFLATLPNQGSSVFLTVLKPCGLILPHVHPRATEQYVIISGEMEGGIAEENGGRQNLTFPITPGQSFVVPQGLVHFNANKQCTPNVFIQVFNSADGGTINLVNSLAALRNVDAGVFTAANLTVSSSSLGAFALDSECLTRCNLGSTGGGTDGISDELKTFLALASGGSSTPTPPTSSPPSTTSSPPPTTSSPPPTPSPPTASSPPSPPSPTDVSSASATETPTPTPTSSSSGSGSPPNNYG